MPPLGRRCGETSTAPTPTKSLGILCGKKSCPQKIRSKGTEPVVVGERNLSRSSKRSRQSIPKASHHHHDIHLGSQEPNRRRSDPMPVGCAGETVAFVPSGRPAPGFSRITVVIQ